jgi:hypothetical protein
MQRPHELTVQAQHGLCRKNQPQKKKAKDIDVLRGEK